LFSVCFYGVGELEPARATGEWPSFPVRRAAAQVAAFYQGLYFDVAWAGEVPDHPGLYQVNLVMDPTVPTGVVPITLLAGGAGVTVEVPVR
jgi:uncharacterized protein (TIGR03437 family)